MTRTRQPGKLRSLHAAAGRGIVIQISADPGSTKAALQQIQEEMRRTEATGTGTGGRIAESYSRIGNEIEGGVPKMAAASAGLRALEGNFTNNIRAAERFVSTLPGMANLLQAAFPVIGATVLATALVRLADEAYHGYQNVVLLKGAIEGLNQLDITVGKKLQTAADEQEAALERMLKKTQGDAAELKQKLAYQSGKGIDIGDDLFYQKEFKDLPTNVKANYETLYKTVAPADIPDRLSRIRKELTDLHGALDLVNSGTTGAFVPNVGGYGPGTLQDPTKYYEARIKAATDVKKLLTAEASKRGANLQDIQTEIASPKPKAERSGNPIAEVAARLAEDQAQSAANLQRSQAAIRLAELENQHRIELTSDEEFYQTKLSIETEALDAEQKAVASKQKGLQSLYESQRRDPNLKRVNGVSSEELKTKEELVKLTDKLYELDTKRAQITSANTTEVVLASRERELATLRIAAQLERERGTGTERQIALIEEETRRKVEQLNLNGDTRGAADTRANADLLAQKLRIADVERQIGETEASYNRQAQTVEDRAGKGRESKLEAEHELNDLRQREAADMQGLVAVYNGLAQTLGGPFKDKAAQLTEELDKLGTPDRHVETEFGKKLADGFSNTVDSIASKALEGRESVGKMAADMLHDMEHLALKLSEQKFVLPLFQKAFGVPVDPQSGGLFGGMGSGGGFGGAVRGIFGGHPSMADAPTSGPTIYQPPRKSGGFNLGGIAEGLAKSGAAALAPRSTVNVINQSSQPVSVGDTQTSFDSQLREMVTHIILTDHMEGGDISKLFGSNN